MSVWTESFWKCDGCGKIAKEGRDGWLELTGCDGRVVHVCLSLHCRELARQMLPPSWLCAECMQQWHAAKAAEAAGGGDDG